MSQVRLINENNEQVGVVSTAEALRLAQEAGLDLVEVAPTDRPPVCRIMDYGKWKYQQKKRHKGRTTHDIQLKEVRLRPKTDPHDRGIKLERAREFLTKGHKVQFTMIFRGRERFHADLGTQGLQAIAEALANQAKMERPPRMEGRRLTMLLAPGRPAPAPPRPSAEQPPVAEQPAQPS